MLLLPVVYYSLGLQHPSPSSPGGGSTPCSAPRRSRACAHELLLRLVIAQQEGQIDAEKNEDRLDKEMTAPLPTLDSRRADSSPPIARMFMTLVPFLCDLLRVLPYRTEPPVHPICHSSTFTTTQVMSSSVRHLPAEVLHLGQQVIFCSIQPRYCRSSPNVPSYAGKFLYS